MNLFREFFSAMNAEKVRYMVVGGVAVNLYGIERATGDIDIVVDFEKENVNKFIGAVKEMGLVPKVPVELDNLADEGKRRSWREEKGMMVFSLYDPENPTFLSMI